MAQLVDDLTQLVAARCNGLTLVKGSLQLPGTFILQHYLRMLLQRDYKVVLVAVEQSVERYSYSCKKLGVNLPQLQQSGRLTCLTPPLADITPTDGGAAAGGPGSSCGTRLQRLCAAVREAAAQRPAAVAGVALIVDSLTALVSGLCTDEQERAAFLHHCCSPAGARQLLLGPHTHDQALPCCVAVGVHADVPEDRSWLTALEHLAHVVVDVEPLPGRVADVDGLATVTQRRLLAEHTQPQHSTDADAGGEGQPCGVRTASPAAGAPPPGQPAPAPGTCQSLYFRTTDLAVRWMPTVSSL